ncbi:MAG TPA: hypothetical protein DCM40_44460, partial [Maribacter sp.]|nr:hypothetical protein [Maribacter sp.]
PYLVQKYKNQKIITTTPMNKRDFLKNAAALSTFVLLPSGLWSCKKEVKKLTRLRTAHIGVGNMGA